LFGQLQSSDRNERLAAAERIGEITWDDPSAVAAEPLAEAIEREPDAEVREALVVAIGSIDSPAAEDALAEARFDPDPNVSSRASNLLQ
jgi:HEAT repeat protein